MPIYFGFFNYDHRSVIQAQNSFNIWFRNGFLFYQCCKNLRALFWQRWIILRWYGSLETKLIILLGFGLSPSNWGLWKAGFRIFACKCRTGRLTLSALGTSIAEAIRSLKTQSISTLFLFIFGFYDTFNERGLSIFPTFFRMFLPCFIWDSAILWDLAFR